MNVGFISIGTSNSISNAKSASKNSEVKSPAIKIPAANIRLNDCSTCSIGNENSFMPKRIMDYLSEHKSLVKAVANEEKSNDGSSSENYIELDNTDSESKNSKLFEQETQFDFEL